MSERTTQVGWPAGRGFFASITMILIGSFHAVAGLAGIVEDGFYGATPDYIFEFSATAWGWIHLIFGILVLFGGLALMTAATWARIVGVLVAMVSAFAAFAFIPRYPVGSIAILALDALVIWALALRADTTAEG